MGFSCGCDLAVEFFHSEERVARKVHRCSECGHEIQPGEVYEHASGKCEGELWSAKTCERCADLRASFSDLGFCVSYGDGLFDDYGDWLDARRPPSANDDDDPPSGNEIAWAVREKHRDWPGRPAFYLQAGR